MKDTRGTLWYRGISVRQCQDANLVYVCEREDTLFSRCLGNFLTSGDVSEGVFPGL